MGNKSDETKAIVSVSYWIQYHSPTRSPAVARGGRPYCPV